jgi:hypothetical protein
MTLQLLGILGLSLFLVLGPAAASLSDPASLPSDLQYDRKSIVIVIEVAKLALSCALLLVEARASSSGRSEGYGLQKVAPFRVGDAARFAVPSVIYTITNNIMLYAMLLVPVNVVYVLLQTKILFTAVLRWLVLGIGISRGKALFVTIIALSCAIVVIPTTAVDLDNGSNGSHKSAGPNMEVSGMPVSESLFGILLLLVVCALSAMAGVYSELLLCSTPGSIHWQNIQLYTIGLVFNFTVSLAHGPLSLRGLNFWVVVYIVRVEGPKFFFFFFFFSATP